MVVIVSRCGKKNFTVIKNNEFFQVYIHISEINYICYILQFLNSEVGWQPFLKQKSRFIHHTHLTLHFKDFITQMHISHTQGVFL